MPGFSTLLARPEAVFFASAGGAATSGGAASSGGVVGAGAALGISAGAFLLGRSGRRHSFARARRVRGGIFRGRVALSSSDRQRRGARRRKRRPDGVNERRAWAAEHARSSARFQPGETTTTLAPIVRFLPSGLVGLLISAALVWLAGCNQKKAPPSKLEEARYLFSSTCARCHGLDGKSGFVALGGKPPQNLTDPAFQRARSDADLVEAITHGKGAMPAFGKLYRPEEIKGLVEVIRGFDATRTVPPASFSGSQP